MVQEGLDYLHRWTAAQISCRMGVNFAGAGVREVWQRPPRSWVKCNIDAAVFDSTGQFGFGSVIRDCQGRFHAARL